jgi:hypothetical protein
MSSPVASFERSSHRLVLRAWLAGLGLAAWALRALGASAAADASGLADEFVGPFPSWADLKRDYGAAGDGTADHTAAFQRALDDLRREDRKRFVLYVPAGIYRVTATLRLLRESHNESKDISIVGEHPETTIVRWDGPAEGVMFDYGAWYSRLGRFTLDGAGKAGTALAHGKSFVTYNEIADMVFRDVGLGIEAGAPGGQGIAETSVLRCKFLRCALAGISIQNFNSLDWFIWHTVFEDCRLGVTNTRGAGNFHVYESLFRRSGEADLSMGNTEYFAFRHNVSIGSKAFFKAGGIGACGMITIQGNGIYEPQDIPIQVGNLGPVLLFDNVIQSAKAPAVKVNPQAGLISVGNIFTVQRPIEAKPEAIVFDDKVVPPNSLRPELPRLPGTPVNRRRAVLEVAAGGGAASLQAVIDTATRLKGQRPVAHLPAGGYSIDRTITVPAGSDVQLVGDGAGTILQWKGDANGPVIRLAGPSRATLRELQLNAGRQTDALVLEDCDQLGARIFLEQANMTSGTEAGLLVERLENADVSLHNINHGDCEVGVKVVGGKRAAAGGKAAGRVVIFSGASSNNRLSYDVTEGGRLLARDIWYESGQQPRFVRLRGSGSFTLHGAKVAVGGQGDQPAVELDGFQGQAAFLTTVFIGPEMRPAKVLVTGNTKAADLLVLGPLTGMGESWLENASPSARVTALETFRYTPGGGATPIPQIGAPNAGFIREMIAQTRRERPGLLTPVPPGKTDMRLFRVIASNARTCIRLSP